MGMLREMGHGGYGRDQEIEGGWVVMHDEELWFADTLEHAIAECWLAVKAAQEVRE